MNQMIKNHFLLQILRSAWGIVILLLMSSCVEGREVVLEFKDVQFFKMEMAAETTVTPVLRLSGLAFHSSLAVSEITTTKEEESMVILVHLTPARAGLRGDFEYRLEIPMSVSTVSFGNERRVIWRRDVGPVQ